MQCGAACLTAVILHYGGRRTLSEVSRLCHPTARGLSMKALADTARELGFDAVCARMTPDSLSRYTLPAILHWNQNHYVVLYRVTGKSGRERYRISDPSSGKRVYGASGFRRHWASCTSGDGSQGIAMFLTPGESFARDEARGDGEGGSMRLLGRYLRQYRTQFLHVFAGLLLGCALQLVMPFLTQSLVDRGIRNSDIGFVWLVLLGELMVVTGRTATDFIRRWLMLHVSMRVNLSLVSDFFIKLLRLPMDFFDTCLMGDLLQRIGDHGRVQGFLTGQVLGTLFSLLSFLVFGAVLLAYSPVVFLIFTAGSVIYAIWISVFLSRRRTLDYELFDCQSRNQSRTYRFVTSMQEIKLQDCENRRRMEWEDTQADLFDVQTRSLRLQQVQEAGSVFINEMKNILVTVFAASSVIDGGMTLGQMLAVQYIIGQLNSPVEQLMGFVYSLQDVRLSLERINEVRGVREEEEGHGRETEIRGIPDIRLEQVCFRYDPHAPGDTVSDVSVTIPHGKVTAIVGASGSGKSTLVKLMLGYYPVRSGAITIAGQDIRAYSVKAWRRKCGVVMQDGVIFSESIARNIAVDDGPIDRERLEYAAGMACIRDYIESLPLGYDTLIGQDGSGLSQGQRQRILIARAVYRNPPFIFLDEATNSLDAVNEHEIVRNLEEFYRGRTVVVVAHRLSTVRHADSIVVLDHGRVAESGTHDELVARKGAYYRLVSNQLELGM